MAVLLERLQVEIDVGAEPLRAAADDRQRERQAVPGGADDRLRRSADAHPCAQGRVLDGWVYRLSGERCARPPVPRDGTTLQQIRENRQPFLEQLVVVGEIEAEQRIRLGKRASSEDDFRAAARNRIEGGE